MPRAVPNGALSGPSAGHGRGPCHLGAVTRGRRPVPGVLALAPAAARRHYPPAAGPVRRGRAQPRSTPRPLPRPRPPAGSDPPLLKLNPRESALIPAGGQRLPRRTPARRPSQRAWRAAANLPLLSARFVRELGLPPDVAPAATRLHALHAHPALCLGGAEDHAPPQVLAPPAQ